MKASENPVSLHILGSLCISIRAHVYINSYMSEAIDTDQSVALMVAKVTIDTDGWKVRNENVY